MTSTISQLYDLEEIDVEDELELELARHFTQYRTAIQGKTEIELHNYLQEKASQSKRDYSEIASALLYGILTDPENARTHFQCLSLVNRDHFSAVLSKLHPIAISIKFQSLRAQTKDQMLWFLNELTGLNVQNVDSIYLCLLRQIRGGDLSQTNTTFCYQMLKLLHSHKNWLEMYPRLIATAVFTYMRMITEHRSSGQFESLQQREIKFVIELLRSKWLACCVIGRDLIRLLQDLSSIPEFSDLWNDLLNEPQSLAISFKGINSLLQTSTPREFLRSRLTPEMEFKLLFILQNLRTNQFQRNLGWFLQRFLSQSEAFNVDVIRFIVAGWYPSNQILQSDIVPRYIVIGSMLRGIKNPVITANVRLAIIYDWLFFKPTDNIMFIEPAMLLMERSAERYPYITMVFMEFLKYSVDEYFPPMRNYMVKSVATGMRVMIDKGVIRGLMPLYSCASIDDTTRANIQDLFSEFIVNGNKNSDGNNTSLPKLPSTVALATPSPTANADTPPQAQPTITKPVDGEDGEIVDHHPIEDDDVDRYLYGEADGEESNGQQMDTETENRSESGNMDGERENTPGSAITNATYVSEIQSETMDIDAEEEKYDTITPAEARDAGDLTTVTTSAATSATGIESNQSYWLFGDSFTRFKQAATAILESTDQLQDDDMLLQMKITKKTLKEILSVYLRMAIPGTTLASSIGPPICDMIIQFFLQHQPSVTNDMDLDNVIDDARTDAFDILMSTLWDTEDGRDKMVDLIASIAHHCKKSHHVVGMRWWSYVAGRAVDGTRDWIPSIVTSYKSFVSHAYPDEPIESSLTRDLQLLAEQNHASFQTIIPLIYQYMPGYTVGNSELLQVLLALILPDQLGQLVTLVRSGILRMYGDTIDTAFLVSTFRLDAYETGSAWQLLVAELQGQQERTENFLNMNDTIALLQSQTLDSITPQLLSLFSAAYPTPSLLEAILQVIPNSPNVTIRDKIHLVMTAFIDWKQQHKSSPALEKSMQLILNMIESRNVNDEITRQLAQQISILQQ